MREKFSSHAADVLPYSGRHTRPVSNGTRYLHGRKVVALQEIQYYNGEGETTARIFRLTYDDSEQVDYPFLFRVGQKVYVLSDW